jgi:Domain of unknown function (DUF4282)
MADEKGFIESLLDFSFVQVVTPRMAKLLYFLHLFLGLVAAIGLIIYCFLQNGAAQGVIALIVCAIGYFLWVLYCRIWIELFLAVFRIVDAVSR